MQKERWQKLACSNFELWRKALKSGDPHQVAMLYSHQATFLPTMSPELKTGEEGAEDYFHHFLQNHPDGKIIRQTVQVIGPNCYLHCGLYNFEVDDPEKGRKIVQARFSYIWKESWLDRLLNFLHLKKRSGWKIIHHHSSLLPL